MYEAVENVSKAQCLDLFMYVGCTKDGVRKQREDLPAPTDAKVVTSGLSNGWEGAT